MPRGEPLLSLFSYFKSPCSVGLAINTSEIHLLKLQINASAISIEQYAMASFSQPEEIVSCLKKLADQLQLRKIPVAIALPNHCVISKRLKLPVYLCEADYEAEITEHLNQYLPGMDEKFCFDFIQLEKQQEDFQEVLLFAARQSQLTPYVEMVNQSGLFVKLVDVDLYALARAAQWSLRQISLVPRYVGLLSGSDFLQFSLLDKNQIIFSQPLSSNDVEKNFPEILQQITKILQVKSISMDQIGYLVLAGEIFLKESVLERLRNQSAIPLHQVDLSKIVYQGDKDYLQTMSPRLLVSFGLALNGYHDDRN